MSENISANTTPTHPDDAAVDKFAAAMKEKLAGAREKGRGGWQESDPTVLSRMLREHIDKGDPRDVANFCMFLWCLGKPIASPAEQPAPSPAPAVERVKVSTQPFCNACGAYLMEVKQDSNSYLSAEQFDADKLGDWYCKCCPKGPSEGSRTHRYFWSRDLDSTTAQADTQPAPVQGEREAFEAWCKTQGWVEAPSARQNGTYVNGALQARWLGWQGRAARAPADSVTAPAGGGEPVATLHCNDIGYVWARVTDSGKLLRFEEPMNLYTTPPAKAADSVLEDAARWFSERDNVLHSLWVLLGDAERQADNDNDPWLKHQVDGFYRQWNSLNKSDLAPKWVRREARAQQEDGVT